MATFNLFKDISKKRVDWRLKVRCTRKWLVPQSERFESSLEFVFMDKEGDRIQATVKGDLIKKFEHIIVEHGLYCIKYVTVRDNKGCYPTTNHFFRLYFFERTYVGQTTDRVFPEKIFNFKSFHDIKTSIHSEDMHLFDVIGRVVCEANEKPRLCTTKTGATRLEFYLEDLQDNRIPCTLWEDYAVNMQSYLEAAGKKPLIVLLQLCRSNAFKGNMGVSNTFHATQLLTDSSIKEIEFFKSSLPKVEQESSYHISQVSSFSYQTIAEELDNQVHDIVTLDTVPAINKDDYVWVIGTISGFNEDSGWYFISCKDCFKKVTKQADGYHCDNCGAFNTEQTRFKLHITVCDGTHFLNFLLWDKECQELIGKTAKELCEKIDLASNKGKNTFKGKNCVFPEEFNKLIGKELLFKVHIQEKNYKRGDSVYVVSRISDSSELVTKYKITDHETVGFEMTDTDKTDQDSVSENEVNSPAKTPHKRPTEDNCADSVVDGRSSGSVSSTIPRKAVKIEKID